MAAATQKPLPLPAQSLPRQPVYQVWPPRIMSLDALDLAGLEKARVQCAMEREAAQLKTEMARLKAEAAARLHVEFGGQRIPFADWLAAIDKEAARFCAENRDELLVDGLKSRDFNHCRVKWRDQPPGLSPLEGFDDEGNLKTLEGVKTWLRAELDEEEELAALIDLNVSWRKRSIIKAYEDKTLAPRVLKKTGFAPREPGETFFFEPLPNALHSHSAATVETSSG